MPFTEQLALSGEFSIFKNAPLEIALEERLQPEYTCPYPLLKEAQVFNSYKHLCALLMEPVKAGKAKQLQLERWSIYFTWTNHKYKFIITEVKSSPLQQELLERLTLRHIYKTLLLSTLYPLLLEDSKREGLPDSNDTPGIVRGVEIRKILYWLGMVNKKCYFKFQGKKFGEVEKEFFSVLRGKNYIALQVVLEELREDKLLITEHRYKVQVDGVIGPLMTDIMQTAAIDNIIRKIMEELKCNSKQDIFLRKLSEKFYYKVNEALLKELKIRYYEECFMFAGTPERIYNHFYSLPGAQVCLDAMQKHCNMKNSERLRLYAENNWRLYQENKNTWSVEKSKNRELPEDYLQQIHKLINRYIEEFPQEEIEQEQMYEKEQILKLPTGELKCHKQIV